MAKHVRWPQTNEGRELAAWLEVRHHFEGAAVWELHAVQVVHQLHYREPTLYCERELIRVLPLGESPQLMFIRDMPDHYPISAGVCRDLPPAPKPNRDVSVALMLGE